MNICYASHVVSNTREKYGKQPGVSCATYMAEGVYAIAISEASFDAKYGEEAAMLTADKAVEYACYNFHSLYGSLNNKDACKSVTEAIRDSITNSSLYQLDCNANYHDWMTSLLLAVTDGNKYFVFQSGDGAIYYKSTNSGMCKITKDVTSADDLQSYYNPLAHHYSYQGRQQQTFVYPPFTQQNTLPVNNNALTSEEIQKLRSIAPAQKTLYGLPYSQYGSSNSIEGFLIVNNKCFINYNPEGFNDLATDIINETRWYGPTYGQRYLKAATEELNTMYPDFSVLPIKGDPARDLGMAVLAIESPASEGTE